MIYTGIGSRKTPPEILKYMVSIGRSLAKLGFFLYSGGADGADSAFEEGCVKAKGHKAIFLPWSGFNGRQDNGIQYIDVGASNYFEHATQIIRKIHPNWQACGSGAKFLHTRNIFQILGPNLDTPTKFVICYTENGNIKGGTATAINLAIQNRIPIINLGDKIYYDNKIFNKSAATKAIKTLVNKNKLCQV